MGQKNDLVPHSWCRVRGEQYMGNILETLRFTLNNSFNNGMKTGMSEIRRDLGKEALEKTLVSLQKGMSEVLKEQEQRRKDIESSIRSFKTTAERRFSKIRTGQNSPRFTIF